jgi:hypothetical protein
MQRAAGALLNAVVGALIALAADSTAKPSPALRILVPAGILAAIYLLLTSKPLVTRFPVLGRIPGALRPEHDRVAVEVTGDTNINYGHQEVGINKGNIFKETVPRARLYGVTENVPDGEAFFSTYRIVLEGRPASLRAVAPDENVIELDMREDKDWSAGFALAYGENPDGFPLVETQNPPPGPYVLEVRLRKPVEGLVPRLRLLSADQL